MKILWNENHTMLDTEMVKAAGTTEFKYENFIGRITMAKTDCEVENASFILMIQNAGYLDGTAEPLNPRSVEANQIIWQGGTVKSGKLDCRSWQDGIFNGTFLHCSDFHNGVFNGNELRCNVFHKGEVNSGKVVCSSWEKGRFNGESLQCNSWFCGSFENGEFTGIRLFSGEFAPVDGTAAAGSGRGILDGKNDDLVFPFTKKDFAGSIAGRTRFIPYALPAPSFQIAGKIRQSLLRRIRRCE